MANAERTRYTRTSERVLVPKRRTEVCASCSQSFTYDHLTGNPRRYCSDECKLLGRKAIASGRRECGTPGCSNPSGYSDGVCNSCYYRRRRTGTVEKRAWSYRSVTSHGYVRLVREEHPLAVSGYVYEHRAVLYDAIGPGPHPCRWCGDMVDWLKGKCVRGSLVPDHLDGNKLNNAESNLVPACNKCNSTRGLFQSWVAKHQDDPWLWKMYREAGSQPPLTEALGPAS